MSECSDSQASSGLDGLAAGTPSDEVAQPEAEATAVSLGLHLSQARQARGLTVADVAQAIKFSSRQIAAIESDDFDQLAGTTFVRGFIRSYAKFLHIDPQPLLMMLEQRPPQVSTMIRLPQVAGTALPQIGETRAPAPYLLLLALLATAVVAAGLIWHFNSSANRDVEMPAPAVPAIGAASLQPAESMNATPVALSFQAAQAIQPNAMAQATQPNDPDHHQLVFVFADKSWVEVRDAAQNLLLAQNNDPGSRQTVAGKPPFALVIGNASSVQLQYDDRQIDLRPYTKVDVARLNLE